MWCEILDSNQLSLRHLIYSQARYLLRNPHRYVWPTLKDLNSDQAGWSRVCYRYTRGVYNGADAQDRTETIQRIGRLSKPLRYHYATSALVITMLLT